MGSSTQFPFPLTLNNGDQLDLFDTKCHFATYIPRLAVSHGPCKALSSQLLTSFHDHKCNNFGLMNAILALSAQHRSHTSRIHPGLPSLDPSLAVQYYYQTLRYIQEAMHLPSYSKSEEILATVMLVSLYEMFDESSIGWQRHLKGVFWIQRAQNVNGLSPGLRQALWWWWIRQDLWAALREGRRSNSFWTPPRPVAEQSQDELADFATILLREAVNFSAKRSTDDASNIETLHSRVKHAETLQRNQESWFKCLGLPFQPLPYLLNKFEDSASGIASKYREEFDPIWIHPPKFAAAIQMYNLARILVYLHCPILDGLGSQARMQRAMQEACNTIYGIAVTLEHPGAHIMSSQCLYGAGFCELNEKRQAGILALLDECERCSGWSVRQLRHNLQRRWCGNEEH